MIAARGERGGPRKWRALLPFLGLLISCRGDVEDHIRKLNSSVPAVRARAALESARRKSQAEDFLPHLIRLLRDDTPLRMKVTGRAMPNMWSSTSPRKEAEIAIRIIGLKSVPYLVESFADDRAYEEGDLRLDLLRHFGEESLTSLIASLSSPRSAQRAGAAGALGIMGDRRAVSPLVPLIDDPDREVQEAALYALSRLGPPADIFPRIVPLVQDRAPENWGRRRAAQSVLCKIDEPQTIDLKVELIRREESMKDSPSLKELFRSLGRIEDERALQALYSAAIGEGYPFDFYSLYSDDARTVIIEIGERAEPFLLRQLDSRELVRRQWAVSLLGHAKRAGTIDRLIPLLQDDLLRRWTVIALGDMGETQRSVPALAGALRRELRRPFDGRCVADMCEVLGKLGDKRAVPLLIQALRPLYERDLGFVENEYELREASEALALLTGVTDLGDDIRKWQAWWSQNKAGWPVLPD